MPLLEKSPTTCDACNKVLYLMQWNSCKGLSNAPVFIMTAVAATTNACVTALEECVFHGDEVIKLPSILPLEVTSGLHLTLLSTAKHARCSNFDLHMYEKVKTALFVSCYGIVQVQLAS